jgi:hypothetical protein
MKTHMLKCLPIIAMILGSMQTTQAQENQEAISTEVNPPLFSGTSGFRKWSFGLNVGALAPFAAIGWQE